jgi:penicillin-binding protein 2
MNGRYRVVYLILALVICVFAVRLVSLQLVSGSDYLEQSEKRTMKTKVISAPRGDIFDRYGRTLVTNTMTNAIVIQKVRGQDNEKLNSVIKNLYMLSERCSYTVTTTFPIDFVDGNLCFIFDESEDSPNAKEYAWKEKFSLEKDSSAEQALNFFAEKYSVKEDDLTYRLKITATRYEMELRDFSYTTDFTFAENITMDMITAIKEQTNAFYGVDITSDAVRTYKYPYTATHILGRVGKINAEELEEMRSKGYKMTSVIGKQGIEKYAESYLCGTDGIAGVEQTKDGRNVAENVIEPAIAGQNVTLTIDLDLQRTAEEALYETVQEIRLKGTSAIDGRYADSGAVVAVDVKTGEVLAMASYPTYDINTFNENYSNLLNDAARPLYNRATSGSYSPGSTFKMLVAAAAMEEGVITPNDVIVDKGRYTYYDGYQPQCWIYRQHGMTHGAETVTDAIRDSCNYFFFDVGRRLTIQKIDEYAEKYGFGQLTGIEIPSEEHSGVVASPENRQSKGSTWYPGDTLQASIGQSDTLVTPVQLASYAAMIANGGTRYKLHLIKSISDSSGTSSTDIEPEILGTVSLSDETYNAITKGMRLVVTEGTGATAFKDCIVDVAAKSGSAQMGKYTNGIYVAYAPYDDPQIAVSVVMEKSSGGSDAAPVARKVIEKYFSSEIDYDGFKDKNTLLG